jgi:hypothetical protein
MRTTTSGRVLATLFIGIIAGIYKHVDEGRWLQRGRDAYLAFQSEHFQRLAQYHSLPHILIAWVLLVTIAVVVYEMIAAGFTRLLPVSTIEE